MIKQNRATAVRIDALNQIAIPIVKGILAGSRTSLAFLRQTNTAKNERAKLKTLG